MTNANSIDRETAQQLMALARRMGDAMNEADPLIRPLPQPVRSELLRALGTLMGHLWDLQRPVVRCHPDLDPDGDRFRKPLT
ncbi:hypothetical protein [Massilia sp. 9096]|uniref:hypothetical protein n=1 Tax=Massilia sp. 9096 TaxID=1500894 RepID=UPI000566EBE4|nr:hypothetical protein [Massilia sp. 9096]